MSLLRMSLFTGVIRERYHVVTKVVSIHLSNKVTLPCRYYDCSLFTGVIRKRCHVVTKIVSIYWINKVTLPGRYKDGLYLLE